MNFDFSSLIALIAALMGALSGSSTVFSLLKTSFKHRKTLEEINEKTFQYALLSGDIKLLGNYLDNTLGDITISEYASNSQIQKKVDNYIQNITNFIGTEEEIKKQPVEKTVDQKSYYSEVPNELQEVVRELRLGQPWNALAKLRRHIEITLKQELRENNLQTKEFIPVNKMLSILNSANLISSSAVSNIRFSVSVCNKAIHGIDISEKEAEEAFFHAIRGLAEIDGNRKSKK